MGLCILQPTIHEDCITGCIWWKNLAFFMKHVQATSNTPFMYSWLQYLSEPLKVIMQSIIHGGCITGCLYMFHKKCLIFPSYATSNTAFVYCWLQYISKPLEVIMQSIIHEGYITGCLPSSLHVILYLGNQYYIVDRIMVA